MAAAEIGARRRLRRRRSTQDHRHRGRPRNAHGEAARLEPRRTAGWQGSSRCSEAQIIDGKALAAALRNRIRDEVARLRRSERLTPGLAVVLVGDDPASDIYVRSKAQQSEEAGMKSFVHRLPADLREEDLLTLMHGLNQDDRVHGILVQLPLPPQIRPDAILAAIDPDKDVDGFHVVNAGRLLAGIGGAMVPCTPLGCLRLIKSKRQDLSGLKAVVVGRSNIVGKPMALLLLAENCTVTIAHSKTRDLPAECRAADILVAAVGRPELIRGDWIKRGRHRHRRRHQPDRRRRRQDPPGRRRGVRGGGAGRGGDHAGAGRGRADDGGVSAAQHADRRLPIAGARRSPSFSFAHACHANSEDLEVCMIPVLLLWRFAENELH